jgi:hypothetical protein
MAEIYLNEKAKLKSHIGDEVLPIGNDPFIDSNLPEQFNAYIDTQSHLLLVEAT